MNKNIVVAISIVFVVFLLVIVAYYMNAGQSFGFPSPLVPAPAESTQHQAVEESQPNDVQEEPSPSNTSDLEILTEDLSVIEEDLIDIENILTDHAANQFESNLDEF